MAKTMKPGDMIEWTYKSDGNVVDGDEKLWSSREDRYVPIGSSMTHTLVHWDGKNYSWRNKEGLFHALVRDEAAKDAVSPRARVVSGGDGTTKKLNITKTMKPGDPKQGDLIEWTYKYNGAVADEDEVLWSSLENRYVPIGSGMVHTLVHWDGETYSWKNPDGKFRALVVDHEGGAQDHVFVRVVSR